MEEIILIKGDSSDIYEFSSKQISNLDDNWEGSWAIAQALESEAILEGELAKNEDILNDDSLIDRDYEIKTTLVDIIDTEDLEIYDNVLNGNILTITGKVISDNNVDREIIVSIEGIDTSYIKTNTGISDVNGEFSINVDLSATIRIPANSFFIFQIMPLQSELLESGTTYILSVEVRQKDSNNILVFRKEVLQAKLKIAKQGVL